MTSKNSVDTIIYEILKEIPDRDTICALDFGLISLAVQQAIEDGGIPKPDHKLTSEEWAALQGDAFREAMTTSTSIVPEGFRLRNRSGDSFRKIRLNSRRCQKMGIC